MTQSSANVVLMAAPAKPSGGDLPPADTARRASPFRDGYDIEGAREHLEDLQENPDPTDPRWPQLVELEEREDMLRRMQARAKEREGAEPVVPDKEARAIREVGKLVSEETDTMTLHTKDAYRLFIGKVKTDKKVYPFVGGKRVASALRSAYYLSGCDNPYADWVLVTFHQALREIRHRLGRDISTKRALLDEQRAKGLSYSILRADPPLNCEIGFRSPYGYQVAELLVEFDYYVRLTKTLVRKAMVTDDEGFDAIKGMGRAIRAIFWAPVNFERYLMRPEMEALSRSDWLPGGDEDAQKRVRAAVGIFGEVPRGVFEARWRLRIRAATSS